MDPSVVAHELMRAAVSGVSKTQATKFVKNLYDQTDEQMQQVLRLCSFNEKPKTIDYRWFANRQFLRNVKSYGFPFTQIYTIDDFLSPADCEILMDKTNRGLRPSTISNPQDKPLTDSYRTSKTTDLHCYDDHYLTYIDDRIADFLGLPNTFGEALQAQKYAPGEYYKEHCDYFFPLTKEYKTYTEWMGQRTWTFMVYLNDVEEGGETYFKRLKLKLKPKKGTAVLWNNLYKNGVPNNKTIHEALPPISGEKYIITKWFRSWSLI